MQDEKISLRRLPVPQSREMLFLKKKSKVHNNGLYQRTLEPTEQAPTSHQWIIWRKTKQQNKTFNPKYEINIHESILMEINNGMTKT